MNVNDINSHPRDSRLSFDAATHTYTVDGRTFESVTTVVERCFEQFDAAYWAARKATPDHTAQQIMQEWEEKGREARESGTHMHSRIEAHYLGNDIAPDMAGDDGTLRQFVDFTAQYSLNPYRTEWPIFDEDNNIAGTLDFLERTPDGTYNIWDWKRSTKLTDGLGRPIVESAFRKCAFPPLHHVPDTTFWHYAMQLSIYRYILSTKYGIEVSSSHLGVFHPRLPHFYVIETPYMLKEVKELMSCRQCTTF